MLGSGDLLGERYRLDERIAAGGMGDVWRATDLVLGRVVAVKVVRGALLADPAFSARFRSEARLLAAFRHAGVVDVYDYGESAGPAVAAGNEAAYLVMAYVEGEPLSARIAAAGRLSVAETTSIITQAARALHAVHANDIIHRDVKPGNLLIQPDGTVILVDFGVAYSAAVTRVTGVNDVIGTALYMAPEQISKLAVTAATDVYALGAVGYHCLAGQPPFTGDNPVQVAMRHLEEEPPPLPPDVPAPIRAVITRAMAKDPADRYSNAAELATAVEAAAVPAAQQGGAASTAAQDAAFAAGRASPGYAETQLAAPAAALAAAEAVGKPDQGAAETGGKPDQDTPTRTYPAPAPVAPAPPAAAKSQNARRRRALAAGTLLSVLLGLAALAAILIPASGGGHDPAPKLTPTSQTSAPAGSKPAQVSDHGTATPASPSRRPATTATATATAPGAGSSPSQPAASRTQNPSPTQNASPTNQQATSPAAASGAPSTTAGTTTDNR